MEKKKPENPPAFPTENEHQSGASLYHYEGMSLRDYFAAKAMQEYVANAIKNTSHWKHTECAAFAYNVADAMLLERSKRP